MIMGNLTTIYLLTDCDRILRKQVNYKNDYQETEAINNGIIL